VLNAVIEILHLIGYQQPPAHEFLLPGGHLRLRDQRELDFTIRERWRLQLLVWDINDTQKVTLPQERGIPHFDLQRRRLVFVHDGECLVPLRVEIALGDFCLRSNLSVEVDLAECVCRSELIRMQTARALYRDFERTNRLFVDVGVFEMGGKGEVAPSPWSALSNPRGLRPAPAPAPAPASSAARVAWAS
jgi:hypothetical protein